VVNMWERKILRKMYGQQPSKEFEGKELKIK
jgi:hypothetical protein